MAGSWQTLHEAVELRSLQLPCPAIKEVPGPLIEEEVRSLASAQARAIPAGGVRLQVATSAVGPQPCRPVSVLDDCPIIVAADTPLTPSARFDLPGMAVVLERAHVQHTCKIYRADYTPPDTELQPGAEPRRIWNRAGLELPDCLPGKAAIRTDHSKLYCDRSEPQDSVFVSAEERRPRTGPLHRIVAEGLSRSPELALKQNHFAPATAIQDLRHIGPRLTVPPPPLPRVR